MESRRQQERLQRARRGPCCGRCSLRLRHSAASSFPRARVLSGIGEETVKSQELTSNSRAQGARQIGGTYSLELVEDGIANAVGDEVVADLGDDVVYDGDVDGGHVAAGHGGRRKRLGLGFAWEAATARRAAAPREGKPGGEEEADETDGELRREYK